MAAVTRYMGHPINWSVDVAVCLFTWCTFLGGDVALRRDKLMCVDVLVRNLPPKDKMGHPAYQFGNNIGISRSTGHLWSKDVIYNKVQNFPGYTVV
ncbi:MAG: TRAP transporter small permease [Deltaproteobacteria bacterium]|nr:TRAP transporter small permease [Deltaproteobacteria bacterium]